VKNWQKTIKEKFDKLLVVYVQFVIMLKKLNEVLS